MTIYTKTGDKGETGLYSSNKQKPIRVSKDSLIIHTLGSIDELNSFLGLVVNKLSPEKLKLPIYSVQENLFSIGAILAGAKLKFPSEETKNLEHQIDVWESKLPVLKNFIQPGGSEVGALLFYARSLARKAERNLVGLAKKTAVDPNVLKYLNRLSDYLFVFARYTNNQKKIKERLWTK